MSIEKYNLEIANVFRREGYHGASMNFISDATGLQKGSLYHHYPNGKSDMAIAAIQTIGETYKRATKSAFHPKNTLREQLEDWAEGIRTFYDDGRSNCILGTMVMSGGKQHCSDILKQAFENWIASLENILTHADIPADEAKTRAYEAVERIQGALIVSRALEDTSNFDRLIQQLPDILLNKTGR